MIAVRTKEMTARIHILDGLTIRVRITKPTSLWGLGFVKRSEGIVGIELTFRRRWSQLSIVFHRMLSRTQFYNKKILMVKDSIQSDTNSCLLTTLQAPQTMMSASEIIFLSLARKNDSGCSL